MQVACERGVDDEKGDVVVAMKSMNDMNGMEEEHETRN